MHTVPSQTQTQTPTPTPALTLPSNLVRDLGDGLILRLDLGVGGNGYARAALRRGLVINCTHDRVLRFLPPFILRAPQVKEFLAKLETILAKTPRPKPAAASAWASCRHTELISPAQ